MKVRMTAREVEDLIVELTEKGEQLKSERNQMRRERDEARTALDGIRHNIEQMKRTWR